MEEGDLSEGAVITGCDHVYASLAGSPSDGVGKLLGGFWIRMGCRFREGTMWCQLVFSQVARSVFVIPPIPICINALRR